jgi:hypothetical protein
MDMTTHIKRLNVFHGARQFMHKWDFFAHREAPSARGAMKNATHQSSAGNLNIAGTDSSSASVIFVQSQDGFLEAIEPGVRRLVALLAHEWDLITYTSCEGHRYEGNREPDVRSAGILPRNAVEEAKWTSILCDMTEHWNSCNPDSPVIATVLSTVLLDGTAELPALDLIFVKRSEASWSQYFGCLDPYTDRFVEALAAWTVSRPAPREVPTLS